MFPKRRESKNKFNPQTIRLALKSWLTRNKLQLSLPWCSAQNNLDLTKKVDK